MEVVKEAEGYKLHLATRSNSTTGYLNVSKMASGHFNAVRMVDGKTVYLGSYNTAVEAAVAVARYEAGEEVVRPAAAAATAVEVKEAEGYHLLLNNKSGHSTGYLGVTRDGDRYIANRNVDGKVVHIGRFHTAVEAAVAVAKHAATPAAVDTHQAEATNAGAELVVDAVIEEEEAPLPPAVMKAVPLPIPPPVPPQRPPALLECFESLMKAPPAPPGQRPHLHQTLIQRRS